MARIKIAGPVMVAMATAAAAVVEAVTHAAAA